MTWIPVRYGRQLWEIGIPNRSAEEFRHGDHYWQWGLYNLYPQEFPHDVDFVIGKSDWRHDWNYAQPPRPDGKGGWKNTTWRIRFEHGPGSPRHRDAAAGDLRRPRRPGRCGRQRAVRSARTGELPESGVMHRDGIRSDALTERNLKFDASLLKPGDERHRTDQTRSHLDGRRAVRLPPLGAARSRGINPM